MLGTPEFLDIHVSKLNSVSEVIKHIMTLYARSFPNKPLRYANDAEAYELRLLDDEEEDDFYKPFYEVSALENNQPIGDF